MRVIAGVRVRVRVRVGVRVKVRVRVLGSLMSSAIIAWGDRGELSLGFGLGLGLALAFGFEAACCRA